MMERRLGTLEDFMQNSGDIMESVTSFNEDTKQKYIVDADVFQSIVDRIEALETGKTVTQNTQDSLATHVPNEQLQAALSEIDVLKDTIIQLQTFVMETHKKLSDIVFSPPAVNDIVTDYTNIFHDATGINTNNIDPNTIKPPTLVRESNLAYIGTSESNILRSKSTGAIPIINEGPQSNNIQVSNKQNLKVWRIFEQPLRQFTRIGRCSRRPSSTHFHKH